MCDGRGTLPHESCLALIHAFLNSRDTGNSNATTFLDANLTRVYCCVPKQRLSCVKPEGEKVTDLRQSLACLPVSISSLYAAIFEMIINNLKLVDTTFFFKYMLFSSLIPRITVHVFVNYVRRSWFCSVYGVPLLCICFHFLC